MSTTEQDLILLTSRVAVNDIKYIQSGNDTCHDLNYLASYLPMNSTKMLNF